MSKRLDRERAKSGMVYRSGSLVDRAEWETAHPTREMQVEAQQAVDQALKDGFAARGSGSYFCSKCNRRHTKGKIHADHKEFAGVVSA